MALFFFIGLLILKLTDDYWNGDIINVFYSKI